MVGLSNLQKEILKIFSKIEEQENFYLTGGTALSAFYLHHRLSEDLDLFTPEEPLINIVGERFRKNLESENFSVNTIRRFSAFFEMVATKKEEGVRIQLALDSPFRFEEPEVAEIGVKIDSLIDIATNKLLTVFGRAEVRDFVDLFFLIKEGYFKLDELIEKSREKDPGLDDYYLAVAFNKVKDFPDELNKLPIILYRKLDFIKLKRFFQEEAMNLLKEGEPKR